MSIKHARILAGILVAAVVATGAAAQEPDAEEITRTGSIADDLFLYGHTITVRAEVSGEVILMGGEVNLPATVEDDVVVMGGDISVGYTIAGDVIAAGGHVVTQGAIGGSVTAVGGDVTLDGVISGDALIAGGSVTADGAIAGKLRMMGGEILNRAEVAGSLLAAGGQVVLDSLSRVAGSARLSGAHVEIGGSIGRNLEVLARTIEIAGDISGDVTLRGVDITILPSARIGGDLVYRSAKEADIHADAQIAGDITFIYSQAP